MTTPFDKSKGPAGFNADVTSATESNEQHRYSDKDGSETALHHTLGPDRLQASPGDHNHDGRNSSDISSRYATKSNLTVTGSRGGNAALTSLLTELHNAGIINNQTIA